MRHLHHSETEHVNLLMSSREDVICVGDLFFLVSGDAKSLRTLFKCGLMLPGLFWDVLGDTLNRPRYIQQHTFSL